HPLGGMADDDNLPRNTRFPRRVEHVFDHRPPANLVQDLRQRGLHPRAFSGRKDDRDWGRHADRGTEYAVQSCEAELRHDAFPSTSSTVLFHLGSILGFLRARSAMILLARNLSRRWTINTLLANFVKKPASSMALSPPPTTTSG